MTLVLALEVRRAAALREEAERKTDLAAASDVI